MEKNYDVYANKETIQYIALGRAVSRWANLEIALLDLSRSGLDLKDMTSISRITSHIRNFSAFLEFVDSCVKLKVSQNNRLEHWNSIKSLVSELAADRNYLAHTAVIAHGKGDPNDADWAEAEPKIGPDPKEHFLGKIKRDAMDTAEVNEIVEDIQSAIQFVISFRSFVEGGETNPKVFSNPVERRRPSRHKRKTS